MIVNNAYRSICITGPESSGKTTLAKALVKELDAILVPEMARAFLEKQGGSYVQLDLLKMAELQRNALKEAIKKASHHAFVIADTDLTVIKIWSEEKFGTVDPMLEQWYTEESFDLYLLCSPDMPWQFDPLRENEFDRDRLFNRYVAELERRRRNYVIVKGNAESRLEYALKTVDELRTP